MSEPTAEDRPLTRGERTFYQFARLTFIIFGRLFWRVSVEGQDNVPTDRPYVVSPVHRSNIDTILMAFVSKRHMRYMAKDSLWRYRWSARVITALGGFPVNRDTADRDALRTKLPKLIKQRIEFCDSDVRATVGDPYRSEAHFKSIGQGPQAARVYSAAAVRRWKSRIGASRSELHRIRASTDRHAITCVNAIVAGDGDEIVKLHGQPYPRARVADEARVR